MFEFTWIYELCVCGGGGGWWWVVGGGWWCH